MSGQGRDVGAMVYRKPQVARFQAKASCRWITSGGLTGSRREGGPLVGMNTDSGPLGGGVAQEGLFCSFGHLSVISCQLTCVVRGLLQRLGEGVAVIEGLHGAGIFG